MQCDVHNDKVAVGFCEACGRMLCRECAVDRDGRLLCKEDAEKLDVATAAVPVTAEPRKKSMVSAKVIEVKNVETVPPASAASLRAELLKPMVVTAKVIDPITVPATESFRVETVQKPADSAPAYATPPLEETNLKVVNSPRLFYLIIVLMALSVGIFLIIGLFSLIASTINPRQNLSIMLYLLLGSFAVMIGLIVAALKYHSMKAIKSAFHFKLRGMRLNNFNAIVADDGIYLEIVNNMFRNRYRRLPWSDIKIQAVNEAEKAISLKSRGREFRLDDRGHFEELKGIIVRHAAREKPVNYVSKKIPLISPARLVTILIALVIIYALLVIYVDSTPIINSPDNDLCDFDGARSAYYFYTKDATSGKEINTLEICQMHGYLLAMIHPDLGLLQWSKIDVALGVVAIASFIIIFVVLLAALYYSIPRWRRMLRYVMV